jgi:hypothetical protein
MTEGLRGRNERRWVAALLVAVVTATVPARADEVAPATAPDDGGATARDDDAADTVGPVAARDAEVQARLRFIAERLDGEVACAQAWTWAWTTFNVAGGAFQAYRAVGTGNAAERTDEIVAAAKAAIGIVGRLARPLYATRGAGELGGLPDATVEEREHKLVVAERLLRRNARETDIRLTWLPHVINVALNVLGAVIVWGVNDAPATAWQSAGIGIAVGEIVIWTQPVRAKRDLGDYQRRFSDEHARAGDGGRDPGPSLRLVGLRGDAVSRTVAGAGFELRF